MKFPRNARIFRGQLDAAPFAIVFSCLLLFLLLSTLIYTPGVSLQMPVASGLPGTDKPTIAVAMDKNGRFYFDNQRLDERDLKSRLQQAAAKSPQPLALLVQADKTVTLDQLIHLALLAREAGILEAWLPALPGSASPGNFFP
jgi:biopolymer transport protein ExbD